MYLKFYHRNFSIIQSFMQSKNDLISCRVTCLYFSAEENMAKEPIFLHFHDIPVYILKVVLWNDVTNGSDNNCKTTVADEDNGDGDADEHDQTDIIYMSEVDRYNHKVCGKSPRANCCDCIGCVCLKALFGVSG
jgi:hypothetical protein